MSLFNSLGIGYSGLDVSQVGISVTGQNIANAETEGYVRQRVIQRAANPVGISPGMQSTGVRVADIERVFDNLTFERFVDVSATKSSSDYMKEKLEVLSTFFPEIDEVGIKTDLHKYFDMWQALADSPDSTAIKVALAQETQNLTEHIHSTREQIRDLQEKVNGEVGAVIDQVNNYAKEIASLNKAIDEVEADGADHANDLRDRRDNLELKLSELINAKVLEGQIPPDSGFKGQEQYREDGKSYGVHSYTIQVAGFNIVDGGTYHPIGSTEGTNQLNFHELYYEMQNGNKIPMEDEIIGGKLGAILDIRGRRPNEVTGVPDDGVLQDTINQLDTFAQGLIEATNNIYAQSATNIMQSNDLNIEPNDPLASSDYNVNQGSFSLVVYDVDGNEVAARDIFINETTTLETSFNVLLNDDQSTTGNSIKEQIEAVKDDNGDNDTTNDVDSYLNATFTDGQFAINVEATKKSLGYTFAIVDKSSTGIDGGTNFAGALGMSRYFDGDDAKNITINSTLQDDPTQIQSYSVNVKGNNDIALAMVQLQFDDINFHEIGTDGDITRDNVYGYFDKLVTWVGSTTEAAITTNNTVTAHYSAAQKEYESVSGVNIDEELTNLIKYQTAYGASAKVITTVDQMMTTLLGIKS
jgi:flagellar hook-associated protein 1 FlgK